MAVLGLTLVAGCGDGRPAFCDDLARVADLSALRKALDVGDLDRAGREARRLVEVADAAPEDVREDLRSLAVAVVDLVELVDHQRSTTVPTTAVPTVPEVTDGGPTTTAAAGEVGETARRQEELNERMGRLSSPSSRVSAWASTHCGIELG